MQAYEIEINSYKNFHGTEQWCAELYLIDKDNDNLSVKTRLSVHITDHKEESYRYTIIDMNKHKEDKYIQSWIDTANYIGEY